MSEPVRDPLTEKVIGIAIGIHRALGPGLLESAYEECFCYDLTENGVRFRRQVPLPVVYKNVNLDCAYRMDIVIEDRLVIELKAVEADEAPRRAIADVSKSQRVPNGTADKFQCAGAEGWRPEIGRMKIPSVPSLCLCASVVIPPVIPAMTFADE